MLENTKENQEKFIFFWYFAHLIVPLHLNLNLANR